MSYAPFTFNEINIAQAHGQPNQVYLNSAIFDYWCRALLQRLTSVFEFEVPDSWLGSNKDFFMYLLFTLGFVGIIDSEKYGYIFQPCSLGKERNIFYQPNSFIINNPYDDSISKEYICGVDGNLLKLTPDYKSVIDVVEFYASRLSFLYSAINTSLLVTRNPKIYASRTKQGAQALKLMNDKILSGDPFVILSDKILWTDSKTKEDAIFNVPTTPVKDDYITNLLLDDEKTIIKEFDSCVGILNIDNTKGERLVTSEAEAQMTNSTASAFVWFDCLKDSIANIKKLYPDIKLDVKLRYDAVNPIKENTNGGDDNVSGSSDIKRN